MGPNDFFRLGSEPAAPQLNAVAIEIEGQATSPENPRFLDSSGTSEVIPSFYLPSSTETRYNIQNQEKDNIHEFLYYYAHWLRPGFDP